jgi:hypothetical protein
MKSNIYVVFISILLGFSTGTAQERQETVNLIDAGISVSFRPEMRDTKESRLMYGAFDSYIFLRDTNLIHRVLIDEKSGLYFGYDIEITPSPYPNMFKVSVKPLSIEPAKQTLNLDRYTSSPPPITFNSLFMKLGVTVELHLLENQQTKARIIDLIKITKSSSMGPEVSPAAPVRSLLSLTTTTNATQISRDFTPDATEPRLVNANLYIDDKRILNSVKESYIAGAGDLLYLYVEGKGRFIFSLVPRRNYKFNKIGVAENTEISFTIDKTKYRLISERPVLELSGKWNVWVLHEPEYTPKIQFKANETYKIGTVVLSE